MFDTDHTLVSKLLAGSVKFHKAEGTLEGSSSTFSSREFKD